MPKVVSGLESFIQNPPSNLRGDRLGLLANPASVDSNYTHARDLIDKSFPGQLKALFSPQHGFFAEKQDNMIESDHMADPILGIPVFSLYGETRIPTKEMLDHIDTLIIDIQDVGTRVYTFIYTISYCMEKAKEYGKKIVILDRPNPVGGEAVEGNCLSENLRSFVGRFPIPMRHGLTTGEISLLFNELYNIKCNLEIIRMNHWERAMYFEDTGLPWVLPSPNLPTPDSAIVYPGQVILEGTNISEARGTTRPFEFFGAPYINCDKILSNKKICDLPGINLRPVAFEPTSGKHAEKVCHGFQIHVTDKCSYKPYKTTLLLLQTIMHEFEDSFQWKQPPYEYEHEKLPIDLIIGDSEIRRKLEEGISVDDLEKNWSERTKTYIEQSKLFHIY